MDEKKKKHTHSKRNERGEVKSERKNAQNHINDKQRNGSKEK